MESFNIENLSLKRTEGIQLINALRNSCETLKELHCWKAFDKKEGPLLIDTGNCRGSGVYTDGIIRKCEWMNVLVYLQCLTTLSLNYAYIATPDGDLLVELSK